VKTNIIFLVAFVCALGFALVAVNPAFACEPRSETDPRCEMPRPKPRVYARVVPTATPAPKPTVNPNAGGAPGDALPIESKWLTIGANQAKWYRIDNGQNFYMDVWLDSKGKQPLTMKAFSPAKSNDLGVNSPMTGQAHPAKDTIEHDYLYRATHAEGVWHLVVINYNAFPVEYRVSLVINADDRQCRTFLRMSSDGNPYLYTDCGMYGMNK